MNHLSENPLTSASKSAAEKALALHIQTGILKSSISLSDMFAIFFKKIHPLYMVDCISILLYNDSLDLVKEAFISTYLSSGAITTNVITQSSALSPVQKTIAQFSFPVLKTMTEWVDEERTNHTLLNNADNYKYHCYIPLEIKNKVIGTLELHNENRELSAEALTFCSNIADLLADVIDQQLNVTQNSTATIRPDKVSVINTDNSESAGSAKELLWLKEQIKHINQSTDLDSFINESAKMFPLVHSTLKQQLDDIMQAGKTLDNNTLHVTEDAIATNNYPEIVGAGPAMTRIFSLMDQVAGSDSTVLILGESGTGKELIARAIHKASGRREQNMVMINCAAIPPNLMESELFGHEKGSFTGATDKRIGKFELANGGTLFLDEIGEMSLDLQVKLLRALQEKEIERVGGKATIKTDVRIISATNRDLLREVEKGRFRRDLYFRLNVFPIALPALRDRTEDIPLLAKHFLEKYAKKSGKQFSGFSKGAIKQMKSYAWPGNIREMEHMIERQILLNKKPIISELPLTISERTLSDEDGHAVKIKTIDENERDHIFNVLQACKGRISGPNGAAKLLGVPPTTLNSKIQRLGLNKKHF